MAYQFKRGSVWRKWDLHVHTPASYEWRNGKRFAQMTLPEEQDALHKVYETIEFSDVDVFAIMDYWTFDGYQKLRKYREQKGLPTAKTAFPGIELRVVSPTKHRLNLHFILSDKLSDQKLNDFKSALTIKIGIRSCPLSDETIREFAQSLDNSKAQMHGFRPISELTPEELFTLGAKTAEVTQESVQKALETLPGKAYILMPWDTYNGLEPLDFTKHTGSSDFLMKLSHIFESRKQEVYDIFVGNKNNSNEKFFDNFQSAIGRPKPVISGSDAHELSDYGKFPGDRATWIKSDPTFEGLQQIIHEPADRVRIQSHVPDEKVDYMVIDKVRYVDPSGVNFSSEWIPLNPNLNAIIGGKSSGKSMLLHHIARTIDLVQVRAVDSGSNYTFDAGVDFEVQWNDGEIDRLSQPRQSRRRITYIPQLYIHNIADNSSNSDLRQLILDVLLQNEQLKPQYEDQKSSIRKLGLQLQQSLVQLTKTLADRQIAIDKLHQIGDYTGVRKEVEKISMQIEDLSKSSNLTESEAKEYQQSNTTLSEIQERTQNIDKFESVVRDLTTYLWEYEQQVSKNIKSHADESIRRVLFDNDMQQQLLDNLSTLRAEISVAFGRGINALGELKTARDVELKDMNSKQDTLMKSLVPLMEKFASQERIEELQSNLVEQKDLLNKLDEQRSEVDIVNQRYDDEISEIHKVYQDMFVGYENLAKTIREFTEVSQDLNLQVELAFNTQNFVEGCLSLLDRRKKLESVFERGFENDEFVFDELTHVETLAHILHSVLDGKVKTKSGVSRDNLLSSLLQDYFEIHYDLIYKGDSIIQMSPGKRGLVLLELLLHLSNSKHPILIDQPEDNLDNRTISAELQVFIQKKKVQRQIVVVTHNANLVVLADAEEVIVANQSGQQSQRDNPSFRFEYVTGSLECSYDERDAPGILQRYGIREHVCDILEGGTDAFIKREEKYGL